jgi:hypothetical protein
MRAYKGLLPNSFLGDAVYVGLTTFWRFAPKAKDLGGLERPGRRPWGRQSAATRPGEF